MITLPYSLVIEATEDPDFFGFYSADLDGFTGIGRSFAVCRQSRAALFFSSMKLRLVVEHDPQTKRWAAFFPELPGCASAGDTEEEAVRNAKEALDLWFEPAPVTFPAGAKVLEVALR
jgi:predicted RNase H-like HicB family nuclease